MSYLILDIETIPDLSLWAPSAKEAERLTISKDVTKGENLFLQLVIDRTDDDLRKLHPLDIEKAHDIAIKGGQTFVADRLAPFLTVSDVKPEFAPLHAHKVVVIGYVWIDSNFNTRKMGARKLRPTLDDEADVLKKWNHFMEENKPTLVTWYGRGFDLPVLMLRSFKAGIAMPWYFSEKDYRYRYSETKHADLCDAMGDYGAARGLKLDAVSKLIGLPGKHGSGDGGEPIDGSQVAEMVSQGKLDLVSDYCVSDVAQTAFVFLRWQLIKGRIGIEIYRTACRTLLATVKEDPATAMSLAPLINEKTLLLEEF